MSASVATAFLKIHSDHPGVPMFANESGVSIEMPDTVWKAMGEPKTIWVKMAVTKRGLDG